MKYFALLALAATFAYAESAGYFKYEDCMKKGKSILEVETFQISPDPISLSEDVVLNIKAKLNRPIPPKTLAKRSLSKKILFGFPLTIPCLFDIGSCSTNHCEYIDSYKVQACPLFPEGHECGCPINDMEFVGQNITVPLPDLSGMAKWLASGQYEMKVVGHDPEKKEDLFCFKIKAQVKA